MPRQMYLYGFTVEGSGEFPIDMLRYDGCYPARESEDSASITASYVFTAPNVQRQIRLLRVWEKGWRPTSRRWESFGWRVLEDSLTVQRWGD